MKNTKLIKSIIYLSICLFLYAFAIIPAYAVDECTADNIRNANNDTLVGKIGENCAQELSRLEAAAKPSRDELQKMNSAIAAFQARIKIIEADVAKKTTEINIGEEQLSEFINIAGRKIHQFYIRSYSFTPLTTFFSSVSVGSFLRELAYQQATLNKDKKLITLTAVSVKDLQDKRDALEQEKITLTTLKADTDKKAEQVRALISQVDAYESQLRSLIAEVSARQQEFLGQKLAGLGIPLFAISGGGCSSDLTNGRDPGFSGGFGFFTYGVPNRVGLNQYGALGRAKAGRSADQILRAYYNFDSYQDVDVDGITIKVNDSNSINQGNIIWSGNLRSYVKRIYEVPSDWPAESLKAQVIAIRSYVLAVTNNGNMSICANQYCQVFKTDLKGGSWDQAVDDGETSKRVMVQGGQPIKAFFSSTHGGYAYNTGDLKGWSPTSYTKRMVDTSSGTVSSFSDLQSNAYDKDSPWFYCDWGGRSQYGRTAWLKPDEVADIVNVILLVRKNSSTRVHLYQTDKPNPEGTDTWDASRVRSELGSDAFNSISNISVNWDMGSGITTQVNVSGDAPSKSFNGDEFKNFFNLRAPSNIQIVGPLFNIERK